VTSSLDKRGQGGNKRLVRRWQKQNDAKTTPRLKPRPAMVLHVFLSKGKKRKKLEEMQRSWGIAVFFKVFFMDCHHQKEKWSS